MSNSKHSWDGRQITGVISGFSEYTTLDRAASKETVVITPDDILKKIHELKKFLDVPELEHTLNVLRTHINDTNNPHRTTLDQYLNQIIDVLYKQFTEQGGTATKEEYAEELFEVLHVASLEEMNTGTDATALISVAGLRNLIHEHEIDPDAHKELLESMFPGEPVVANPVFAMDSDVGIPEGCVFKDEYESQFTKVPYTYVGRDRKIHLADSTDTLPIDYQYGVPLIPCFGFRTNSIPNSNGVSVFPVENIQTIGGNPDLMDETNAFAIKNVPSDNAVLHTVTLPDVGLVTNEYRTFSIYAKGENAQYLMISYTDYLSQMVVRAIFDLTTGEHLLINPLTRYGCDCCKIRDGWYRCALTLYSNVDQSSDLTLTFFKTKDPNLQDFTFINTTDGILGYLWGMQLENGNNMSPYMPTNGTEVCRDPLYIKKELSEITDKVMTVTCLTKNIPVWYGKDTRPIHVVANGDSFASEVNMRPTGFIDFLKWGTVSGSGVDFKTLMNVYPLGPFDDPYCATTSSISESGVVNAYNKKTTFALTPPLYDIGRTVYFGYNGADYYEGYIKSIVIYTNGITEKQAVFLNGETVYDCE